MSRRTFFGRRMPFFGNRAMLIMCCVFFVLPFILRGAREAVDGIKNDVADWLPQSFDETTELAFFRKFFVGDQFVVVSWDGCNERDPNYRKFLDRIKEESLAGREAAEARLATLEPDSPEYKELKENLDARAWATELGLHTTGSYFEDWGLYKEKWLVGKDKQWYFIRRDGSVFRWDGQNNLIDGARRFIKGFLSGQNEATGTFVKQWGERTDNRFYADPHLLSARFFVDVTTGPDVFRQMAGPDGTMKMGDYKSDDLASFKAEIETHKRLTGVLFGPTPSTEFDWTYDSLREQVPEETRDLLNESRRVTFDSFISDLLQEKFNGDITALREAPQSTRLEHWYYMWRHLGIEAPPRQTCFVVTLNDPVLDELARVVGRPVLGKPRGRIQEIASGVCGIEPKNLHIGGPPVDNVAIDEEGSITLFKLVGFSAFIGISLAWLSFRSIRVTLMLFFVGGVAAIGSLAIVWVSGGTLDAILMTMPSLIYVMGLSSAVHVVNYYRDACEEVGEARAADVAVSHGLFPCALAAFTTALGLASLCMSSLTPINKFGFYSAIAVVATVVLLFTYLPSSLTIWPPGYGRKREDEVPLGQKFSITKYVEHFWEAVGGWVIRHNRLVLAVGLCLMVLMALGVPKIRTSVQLLKLFRSDAKILEDYRWMESNLGKLVPMELLLMVDADAALRPEELPPTDQLTNEQQLAIDLKLDLLQRIELSDRVRRYVLQVFGDESSVPERRVIGNVMSTDLTTPLKWAVSSQQQGARSRISTNAELEFKKDALLDQDFLRVSKTNEELWRISLRLAALNDVDYGRFVSEMKTVVEPVLSAYRYRLKVLREMHRIHSSREQGNLLIVGPAPVKPVEADEPEPQIGLTPDGKVNQSGIFVNTLRDLIENSGFVRRSANDQSRTYSWTDVDRLQEALDQGRVESTDDMWRRVDRFDCVVVIGDHPLVNLDLIRENAKSVIHVDDYQYIIDPETKSALPGMMTAAERKAEGDDNALIKASYTGIVPIVYKAQRSLLTSLIESILLSFVMIAIVMMVLLRPWGDRWTIGNALNVPAGMLAMIPNILPIVIVFGAMGHVGNLVDIGSMMTASVAMGIAVDDTIHFLNWFRQGVASGQDRHSAVRFAYGKVAIAMTQTTLIAGLGLSAFAFSTFMPTQRFGIFMLYLLIAALVGDLILLPALLSSPLGKVFCNLKPGPNGWDDGGDGESVDELADEGEVDLARAAEATATDSSGSNKEGPPDREAEMKKDEAHGRQGAASPHLFSRKGRIRDVS